MAKKKHNMTEAEIEAAWKALQNSRAERETAATIKKNTPLIGTCWVGRNNFSCPEKPSDYWKVFTRVIGIDEFGWFIVSETQVDKYGDVSFRVYESHRTLDGKQISESEYTRGITDAVNRAASVGLGTAKRLGDKS